MHLSKAHAREDVQQTVVCTLWEFFHPGGNFAKNLDHHGQPVATREWLVNPISGLGYPQPPSSQALKFMRRYSSYTPIPWKIVPRWVWGQTTSTRWGSHWVGQSLSGFPASMSENSLFMVSNQRVRLFDFDTGICTVVVKKGIDNQGMAMEIGLRTSSCQEALMPLTSYDPEYTWFTEPIVAGCNLYFSPLRLNNNKVKQRALDLLLKITTPTRTTIAATEYCAHLRARQLNMLHIISERSKFDTHPLATVLDRLRNMSAQAGQIEVAFSHGDFTPGNLIVEDRGDRIHIVDWEYAGERWHWFDELYFLLSPLPAKGLDKHFRKFLNNAATQPLQSTHGTAADLSPQLYALFWAEHAERTLRNLQLFYKERTWQRLPDYVNELSHIAAFLEKQSN